MRREPDYLTKMIEPVVTGMGYEFVGAELISQGREPVLRVFIDSVTGVVVDDCAKVSHQLSGVLDVDDPISGNYQLEISSPGINRRLFKLVDFDRFKGQTAEIQLSQQLDGRRNLAGALMGIREQAVIMVVDQETREIPFSLIKKAYLVPQTTGL